MTGTEVAAGTGRRLMDEGFDVALPAVHDGTLLEITSGP